MSIVVTQSPAIVQPPPARRRSIADLLAPLDQIAAHSPNLVANHDARFGVGGETYELPHSSHRCFPRSAIAFGHLRNIITHR
jgi:hypothetical protein